MRIPLVLLALMLYGCGSSPAAPTPTLVNVSGNWAGTYFAETGPATTGSTRLVLTQQGSGLTGTWSTQGGNGDGSGTASGTLNATSATAGSFTLRLTSSDPRFCGYQVTGTIAAGSSMLGQWVTVSCSVAASGRISLSR